MPDAPHILRHSILVPYHVWGMSSQGPYMLTQEEMLSELCWDSATANFQVPSLLVCA